LKSKHPEVNEPANALPKDEKAHTVMRLETGAGTEPMLVAITREVSPSISRCELTCLPRKTIDVNLARRQHRQYEDCLARLGCAVQRLPAELELPDSVFVEDTCVVLDELAIIARPGADSRRRETQSIAEVLKPYRKLSFIEPPGTIDGGDVLSLGKSLFVGLSRRTNRAAIEQLLALLTPHAYTVKAANLTDCLHLKTAVTQVAAKTILVNRSWVEPSIFGDVAVIHVHPSEPWGANALLVHETVVYPAAYPETRKRLEKHGIRVDTVDVSELAKAEGGVTCCSVIFRIPDLPKVDPAMRA
jgi:dimethylargininase